MLQRPAYSVGFLLHACVRKSGNRLREVRAHIRLGTRMLEGDGKIWRGFVCKRQSAPTDGELLL